jgi:hypothetical protein
VGGGAQTSKSGVFAVIPAPLPRLPNQHLRRSTLGGSVRGCCGEFSLASLSRLPVGEAKVGSMGRHSADARSRPSAGDP